MKIDSLIERRKLRRKVQGIAAGLLPFASDGCVAVEAFQRHVAATQSAGLMNAVNMDTGYVNYLDHAQKEDVLRWTREALGSSVPFVAGTYIEGQSDNGPGDVVALYRREMERIVAHGGIPILFQTARLHGKSAEEKAAVYREICRGFPRARAFEPRPMLPPNGEIFDEETVRRLMHIPELAGMKHSSLDRIVGLGRLALREWQRPGVQIYTGNDLGINMIEYGSGSPLVLATFCPEKVRGRVRPWGCG